MTELFGELRSVLSQGPTPESWETLKRHLSSIHPDALPQVIPWLAHHLRAWPDHLRVVSVRPYHPIPTLDDRWFEQLTLGSPLPAFRLVRRLFLSHGAHVSPQAFTTLITHPDLEGLTTLELPKLELGEERCLALAESPHLGHIHTLDLSSNRLTRRALEALASSPHITGLRRLDLSENWLSDGLDALATGPPLPHLMSLDLTSCLHGVGTELGHVLCHEHLPALRELSLERCAWGDDALGAMLQARPPRDLSRLSLGGNTLTGAGLAALLGSPWARSLRTLELDDETLTSNRFDPDTLDHICTRGDLDDLQTLKVDGCLENANLFLRALSLRDGLKVSVLSLNPRGLTDAQLNLFLTSPAAQRLRQLLIGSRHTYHHGALTDATIDTLANTKLPRELRQLVLQGHFTESCALSLQLLLHANPDLGVLISTPRAASLRDLKDLPLERLMILD